LTDFKFNQIEI